MPIVNATKIFKETRLLLHSRGISGEQYIQDGNTLLADGTYFSYYMLLAGKNKVLSEC